MSSYVIPNLANACRVLALVAESEQGLSLTELEQRLNNRGQDSAEVIAKRMAQAQSEMSHANEYEYLIINDNFDTALTELERIVLAQRNGYGSQAARQQALLSQLLANCAN